MECSICGQKDIDDMKSHDAQNHEAMEGYLDDEDKIVETDNIEDEFTVEESWDNKSFAYKTFAFETIGFTQGDAATMANVNWYNLSNEVKNAIEVEEEEKSSKRDEDVDIYNDEGNVPDTQIDEMDDIDYNIIGESRTARSKYECEWCNGGFKSNESLLTHYNDIHVKANEFSIDVPIACPFCMEDLGENQTMGEHLANNHGIVSNSGLGEEEPVFVEDAYEEMDNTIDTNIEPFADEGGHGSGPQGGTANLPEQAAMGNINPNYDAFSPDTGDPYESPMTEALDEDDLTKPLDEIEADETLKKKKILTTEFDEQKINRDNDGQFASKGGGSSSSSGKDSGFTISDYKENEDNNDHTENAYQLVKKFGTPDELDEMEGIKQRHEQNNEISADDYTARYEISQKYVKQLKGDSPKEPESKLTGTSTKDLVKQIKGGSKDFHDWYRDAKPENEELYAEIEKRNKEIPRPTGKFESGIFRDDPDAVSKMENKIKVLEERKEYWKSITKFPTRDYHTRPTQLGDAKFYELSNLSANLNDARKKLVGIKAQHDRGTTLTRNTTYKTDVGGGSKQRFYYKEEPKGESVEDIYNDIENITKEE